VRCVLDAEAGNVSSAARRLRIPRSRLYTLMSEIPAQSSDWPPPSEVVAAMEESPAGPPNGGPARPSTGRLTKSSCAPYTGQANRWMGKAEVQVETGASTRFETATR
jgi:hypothetical protein